MILHNLLKNFPNYWILFYELNVLHEQLFEQFLLQVIDELKMVEITQLPFLLVNHIHEFLSVGPTTITDRPE